MSNVIGGGTKIHLMKYRGVEMKDGKPQLKISNEGRTMMACGGRNKGMYNAVQFGMWVKESPELCCKKCVSRFNALMLEAKKLKQIAAA